MSLNIRLKHEKTSPIGSIETLDMEKYLEGVVQAELGLTTNLEALKAQAIVARTYATFRINKNKNYDITDTTNHQAYTTKNISSAVKKAVADTSGIVLTYNNSLADVYYSSSNGGKTYTPKQAWGSGGATYSYLVSKTDEYTRRSGYKKFGHGVGMSQRGAIQAASEGLDYRQILSFYFPGTTLKSNYNGVTSNTVGANTPTSNPISNKGNVIVEKATELLGKPYSANPNIPNSFNYSDWVRYVYEEAIGYDWKGEPNFKSIAQNHGRVVSNMLAGDLVVFNIKIRVTGSYIGPMNKTVDFTNIGIATGNEDEFIILPIGSTIQRQKLSTSGTYNQDSFIKIKRIVQDTETSIYSESSTPAVEPIPSMTNEEIEQYVAGIVSQADIYRNLSLDAIEDLVEINDEYYKAENSRYGMLIDLTNGGSFRFIVPEYNEDLQANFDSASILGRSSDVKGYNNTQSESINISLELIAGAGIYENTSASLEYPVTRMHRDIAFVKSLEYPDYSKAIVLPPPNVLLYLNPITKIRGIVQGVSVQYKKPYDTRNRPMMATLSFTVVHVTDTPSDYRDVRDMKDTAFL